MLELLLTFVMRGALDVGLLRAWGLDTGVPDPKDLKLGQAVRTLNLER